MVIGIIGETWVEVGLILLNLRALTSVASFSTEAMMSREPKRYRKWANGMDGGIVNPLGARDYFSASMRLPIEIHLVPLNCTSCSWVMGV